MGEKKGKCIIIIYIKWSSCLYYSKEKFLDGLTRDKQTKDFILYSVQNVISFNKTFYSYF